MSELIEGEDFYYNKEGYLVFTSSYHLKRGDCCGNGCLHCPYQYKNVEFNWRKILLEQRPPIILMNTFKK